MEEDDRRRRAGSIVTGGYAALGSCGPRVGLLRKRRAAEMEGYFAFRRIDYLSSASCTILTDDRGLQRTSGNRSKFDGDRATHALEMGGVMNPVALYGTHGQDVEGAQEATNELPITDAVPAVLLTHEDKRALREPLAMATSKFVEDPGAQPVNIGLAKRISKTFYRDGRRGAGTENGMHAARLDKRHRRSLKENARLYAPIPAEQLAGFEKFGGDNRERYTPPDESFIATYNRIPEAPLGDRTLVKRRRIEEAPSLAEWVPETSQVTEVTDEPEDDTMEIGRERTADSAQRLMLQFVREQPEGFIELDSNSEPAQAERAIQHLVDTQDSESFANLTSSEKVLRAMRYASGTTPGVTITDDDGEEEGVEEAVQMNPPPAPAPGRRAPEPPTDPAERVKKKPAGLPSWEGKYSTNPDITHQILLNLLDISEMSNNIMFYDQVVQALGRVDTSSYVPQNTNITEDTVQLAKVVRKFLEYMMREPYPFETPCRKREKKTCIGFSVMSVANPFGCVSLQSALNTHIQPLVPRIKNALSDELCWLCKHFKYCAAMTAAQANNIKNAPAHYTASPVAVCVNQEGEFRPTDCFMPRADGFDGIRGPLVRLSLTGLDEAVVTHQGYTARSYVFNAPMPTICREVNFPTGSSGHPYQIKA